MRRQLFTDDHEQYRETVREFIAREVSPRHSRWEAEHEIDRSVFFAAAKQGVSGLEIPELFGGAGVLDYRYRMIVQEEVARAHVTSWGGVVGTQDDLILSYLLDLADDEQKQRWLPGFAVGELIGAIAMTEPGTGSDLQGIATSARRDGDDWILNGQKTFITCGTTADLVIVVARTDASAGSKGFSLLVVERDMPGFSRGEPLEKIGLDAQGTCELYFDDVRLPARNLLGGEGRGFASLMRHLPRERLAVTGGAYASARAIFELTRDYCFERTAFGRRIGDFQHVRFELAEIATELDVAESFVDNSIRAYNAGQLTAVDAAKGKWWASELQKRVVDRCLQLHGGYGYMKEYPVARAYLDSRVQTIYGGTTEIMKEIIGRDLTPRS